MMNYMRIKKKDLEIMASGSLIGMVMINNIKPGPLKILIEQSNIAWRQENGGPEILLLPEYTPLCLMQDVITLTKMGYELTIDEFNT